MPKLITRGRIGRYAPLAAIAAAALTLLGQSLTKKARAQTTEPDSGTAVETGIVGPADVPGLSRYTYSVATTHPTDVIAVTDWIVDKTTARTVGPTTGPSCQVEFDDKTPDLVTVLCHYTLNGQSYLGIKPVVLVKVEFQPLRITRPGNANLAGGDSQSFVSDGTSVTTTTTFPADNMSLFPFTGTTQPAELFVNPLSSGAAMGGRFGGPGGLPPAIEMDYQFVLTAPEGREDSIKRIQVGMIQNASETGKAWYMGGDNEADYEADQTALGNPVTAATRPEERGLHLPSQSTVDWTDDPYKKNAEMDKFLQWPWQGTFERSPYGATTSPFKPEFPWNDSPALEIPRFFDPNNAVHDYNELASTRPTATQPSTQPAEVDDTFVLSRGANNRRR